MTSKLMENENKVNVPLLDLKAQYASIRDQVCAAVAEVLESQVCIMGPKVVDLEKKIAEISNCKFAVGVSSGTDAILCTLMSLDVGTGDEVITTPFTFFATAGCIARLGAKPVFVDIDPKTYNLDVTQLGNAITSRTRAILPVHLFGQMCDMTALSKIAAEHGIPVVEDAAQAISSSWRGQKAGSIGIAGCFSFFPSKNLGAAGDGGMVVTNDPTLFERLTMMRSHGAKPKYFHKLVGGNFRLDALQAAILLAKLPHLSAWSEARRAHAAYYDLRFEGTGVTTPWVHPDCVTIYNQYVIQVPNRGELIDYLKTRGVGTEIYYPLPLHLQDCFHYLGYTEGDFPVAEKAAKEVLALPIYPELTDQMREWVADSVLAGSQAAVAALR
jgi:dTDP-4-amino-4,6-dideoxygalactose transaminase